MDMRKESHRLAKELQRVRSKKIKNLKQRISSGQYQVQPNKVARSILVGE